MGDRFQYPNLCFDPGQESQSLFPTSQLNVQLHRIILDCISIPASPFFVSPSQFWFAHFEGHETP